MNSCHLFNIKKKRPLNVLFSFLPKVRKLEIAKFSKRLQRDLKIQEVLYEIYSLQQTKEKRCYDLNEYTDEDKKEILHSLFEISFLPFFNGIGFKLEGHTKRITKILTIPSFPQLENGLASFGMDNYINIWNIQTKTLYARFFPLTHEDIIIRLLLYTEVDSKDHTRSKTYLLLLTWDKLLMKIDLETKSIVIVHQLQQNDKLIDGVVYKNKYLVTSGYDKNIIVWSLKEEDNFKKVATLKGHDSSVSKLLELNNGRLASGSWDSSIKIWKMEDNFECEYTISTITEDEERIKTEDLIQLKDGRLCALGSHGFVTVYSKDYKNIDCIFAGQVFLVQLTDGRIATSIGEECFQLYNINTQREELIYKTKHSDSITHLQQLVDGRIATSSNDKTILIHGFRTRKELHPDSSDFLYEYYDGCLSIIYNK